MQDVLDWIEQTGLENIIWATDLDLTVLDAQKDPGKVHAEPGLEDAFKRLDDATGGKFFIITGREMSYIDQVFPNGDFKSSAEYHNMVRFGNDGTIEEPNPRPHWDLIDDQLQAIVDKYEGMRMRIKPFMRSIHHSHAASLKNPEIFARAKREIQDVLDYHADETGNVLENIDGGKVFDVAPEGSNKGKAMNDIMQLVLESYADGQPRKQPVPIYFGDSPGDIPAAAVVKMRGGVFVQIGDDPRLEPYADFKLDDPQACRDMIQAVVPESTPAPAPSRDQGQKQGRKLRF